MFSIVYPESLVSEVRRHPLVFLSLYPYPILMTFQDSSSSKYGTLSPRYRCVEEYVYVDEKGNVTATLETISTQPLLLYQPLNESA